MLITLLVSSVLALDIAPAESPPDRRYKIEAYGYAPLACSNLDNCRWNLDWRDVNLEFWSAILECTRDGKNTDKCTFADDKIEFGYIIAGETQAKVYELPADFWLEVSHNKKGQVKLLAEGDREAFWKDASNALIGRFHKPEGLEFKPDSWREMGSGIEDAMRYWLAGALEFQHPKEPAMKTWKAKAPIIAQTWAGGAYNGTMDMKVSGGQDDHVTVSGAGHFSEMHPTRSNWNASGNCAWAGVFDTKRGVLVESRSEVAFTQTGAGYFTQRLTVMREAREGDTFHAGEITGTPFKPE